MKMKTELTTTTKIKDISKHTFTSKDGKETSIVIVQTEDGNFSNFENIWKKQKLDLDNIKEGDFVEVHTPKGIVEYEILKIEYIKIND